MQVQAELSVFFIWVSGQSLPRQSHHGAALGFRVDSPSMGASKIYMFFAEFPIALSVSDWLGLVGDGIVGKIKT